jgi:hypothetical protein
LRTSTPTRLLAAASLALLLGAAVPGASRAALEILEPERILREHVVERGGSTWLRLDGREWELVTDPASPLVSQLGDGQFHPMDPIEVREAVRQLGPGLRPADGRILVLPYPRRDVVESSCDGTLIFLAPGIREVSPEHVHSTVVHEIGHLVQRASIPEGSALWAQYVALRGLGDTSRFHETAPHRDRPREIFAEDFRYLHGGPLATFSGGIENPDLPLPDTLPDLVDWFARALRHPAVAAYDDDPLTSPNPFDSQAAGLLTVRFPTPERAAGAQHAVVYDLAGRRVRELAEGWVTHEEVTFTWNGRESSGRRVASGIYFVRWLENPSPEAARVHVLR